MLSCLPDLDLVTFDQTDGGLPAPLEATPYDLPCDFAAAQTTAGACGAQRLHVLVVDDDASFARACARLLETSGHVARIAGNAQQAIRLGQEHRFDAVVADFNLPDGNGLQVLRCLRATGANPPFVLVTGDPQIEAARAAVESGALSYLVKPISAMQLDSVVERALLAKRDADLIRAAAAQAELRRRLEQSYDDAIGRLWIAFQPIISWKHKTIAGYEAVLRTTVPAFADPAELVRAADELQQLVTLGRQTRRQVAGLMVGDSIMPNVFISLHSVELLDDELYRSDSPLTAMAHHVFLQIKERTALADPEDFVRRTRRLRAMGYRLVLSDIAGTGSGLGSLAFLEPDAVKLDIAPLRQLAEPAVRHRLLRLAVHVCDDLEIPLVAEGVATEEERNTLAIAGGNLMQGPLFADADFPPPPPRF